MFLKRRQQNFKSILSAIKLSQRRKELRLGLIVLFVLLSGALIYRYLARSNILHDVVKPTLKIGWQLPSNYLQGLLSNPEKISIDIKFQDYQKILQKRDEALKQALLTSSDDDYVPAIVHYKNKNVPVDIRLKGDAIDHIAGDKWSFRIKVKKNDTLFGMNRFSVQAPARRNYIDEWIFHQLLENEGLPFLRYSFIDITLNGKHLGTYALEEFFSSALLTNNKLPEGPILKFNESLFFDLVLRSGTWKAHVPDPLDEIYIANPIDNFESSKLADPISYGQFQKAKNLLEGFRTGRLTTNQVFDVKKLAKFSAIIDLTNAIHTSGWTNLRFYFNPITSRLEPIGYDAFTNIEGPITSLIGYPPKKEDSEDSIYNLRNSLFKDMEFFKEYTKQLYRMSQPGYIEGFFNDINKELKKNLRIIWRSEPLFSFSKDSSNTAPENIYQNRQYIMNALDPIVGIRAYLKESSPKVIVEVANIQPLPVVFQGKILPGRIPNTPLVFQDFELKEVPKTLNYQILGVDKIHNTDVIPWTVLDLKDIEKIKEKQTANYYLFDFLSVNWQEKTILVKPGAWSITADLIIPSGFTFTAGPASGIDIKNSAMIISYSPLKFIGNDEQPVRITSSDKTSKGIWVYAPEKSYLENTVFSNNLINFYESPSYINKTYFSGHSTYDDTLHITRSNFQISDSSFKDAESDAIDIDFGEGTISKTSFSGIGNDAMDFSGSKVVVKNNQVKNAGDKGISAGENSFIKVENLSITDSNIGIASKDLSAVDAKNVTIKNGKIGIAVFQKKPEFGPGQATILNLKIENTAQEFLVEKKSFLKVNGQIVEDKETNLKKELY